jgi:hypothetical protein
MIGSLTANTAAKNYLEGQLNDTLSLTMPQAKVKKGNVIGQTTVEINLGIIKIIRTEVACDGMADRICYEKKGEETAGSTDAGLLIPSLNELHEGTLQNNVIEILNSHGGHTVTYDFIKDTYTLTIVPE